MKSEEPHWDWVYSVIFGSDSNTLASGSRDGTIQLWNIQKSDRAFLKPPRPYENTNIAGAQGLTKAQRASLLALGAVDNSVL